MSVEFLQVPVRGLVLRGSAHLPDGDEGPFPTAVMHHGFAANRMETSIGFVEVARALNAAGIAAVAFDRAGQGESDGSFRDNTVSGDVEDSKTLLRALADCDFVDDGNLHLVGASLGAVIASVVAAETDLSVRSLTMVSAAAVFVDDIRRGTIQGRPFGEIPPDGFFDFNGARLGPRFFADARQFDVFGRARAFRGAVRIVHGMADPIAPASYVDRYLLLYGDRAEAALVPEADHFWMRVDHRDVLRTQITEFIQAHAADPC